MLVTFVALTVATGLFLILRAACEKMLGRPFDQEYFLPIVTANRLRFPAIQKIIEESEAPVEHARLPKMLKADFLALTSLLKKAAAANRRYWRYELLLVVYFRLIFSSLTVRRLLRLEQKPAIRKLTAVLGYLAIVAGEQKIGTRITNPVFLNLLEDVPYITPQEFFRRLVQPRRLLLGTSLEMSGVGRANS